MNSSSGWPGVREQILARYLTLLAQANSPLLDAGAPALAQLKTQLLAVVDTVHAKLLGVPEVSPETSDTRLSESIGRTRATAKIHPSQSLRAASMIFEAAITSISKELRDAGIPNPELTAAVALNAEILERMSAAARAYVEFLLDKAESSNRDERRRLSRELHDVAAPAVAVGLQNLELYEVYAGSDAERAMLKIAAARQSLIDALATIRSLSAQSRESVAAHGLVEAIQRYLDTLPAQTEPRFRVKGSLAEVPLSYAEELFLIIREAVRNAVDHGKSGRVSVSLVASEGEVRAQIVDDGVGFDVEEALEAQHVGIEAMYERADLLGAHLEISSKSGKGTTVRISVSLPSDTNSTGEASHE